MSIDPNLVAHCEFKQSAGNLAMERLLDLSAPPTAVFAASNLLTLGALQAIHARNLAIPERIAVWGRRHALGHVAAAAADYHCPAGI